MHKKHGLKNPLGCPFCKETFSGKAAQMSHISTCEELKPPRRTKDFVCPRPKCGKRYVDEVSLATRIADHDDKIVHPVCAYCRKTFPKTVHPFNCISRIHVNLCQLRNLQKRRRRRPSPNNLLFRTF